MEGVGADDRCPLSGSTGERRTDPDKRGALVEHLDDFLDVDDDRRLVFLSCKRLARAESKDVWNQWAYF